MSNSAVSTFGVVARRCRWEIEGDENMVLRVFCFSTSSVRHKNPNYATFCKTRDVRYTI